MQRFEEVESLLETSRLSREAIIEKLKPKKKKERKSNDDTPADLEKQDYDEVELDDLEGE